MLSKHVNERTGMSEHTYAIRYGWTFELELSAEEYSEACKHFISKSEMESIAKKAIIQKINSRHSFLGRLLSFLKGK